MPFTLARSPPVRNLPFGPTVETSFSTRSSCAAETSGPISVCCEAGSPTRICPTNSRKRSVKSLKRDSWTYMRVAAVQSCPVLTKPAQTAPCAAASMSASSKTMKGALPPSSMWTRLSVPAAARMTALPVSLAPVSEIRRTSGCATSATPTSSPPVTMFSTPSGMPASSASSPSISAVSGVSGAGLRTTVLPAASAGPIFQIAIISG